MRINDKENYDKIKNSITMKNLKEIIDSKGYSVTKVATNSKISDSTIFAYINSQKIPSLPTLISLADYLNVNIDYLVDRTDNPLKIDELSNFKPEVAQFIERYLSLSNDQMKQVEGYIDCLLEKNKH